MITTLIAIALSITVVAATAIAYFYRRPSKLLPFHALNNELTKWVYTLDTDKVTIKPGDMIQEDFRRDTTALRKEFLRVASMNIQYGTNIDYVMSELKRIEPDIIFLQQLGMRMRKGHGLDTGKEIAQFLHMNYVFVCEDVFREGKRKCAMGNAILSKFDIDEKSLILLQCHDKKRQFVRKDLCNKHHTTPVLTMKLPKDSPLPVTHLQVFGLHIEEHAAGFGLDNKQTAKQVLDYAGNFRPDNAFQIIAGDFAQPKLSQRKQFGKAGFVDPFEPSFTDSWTTYKRTSDKDVTSISDNGLYGTKLDWILSRGDELQAVNANVACTNLSRRMVVADYVAAKSSN
jgi:endonuclease/exonuclease/phosphatase family metal-dependent hydrolase